MPYRRLPNTNVARMRALKTAVEKNTDLNFNDRVLRPATYEKARAMVRQYETLLVQYQDSYIARTNASKKYVTDLQKARMYVSHFIQVFNLAVVRGEIKRPLKAYYQLDPKEDTMPPLSTEEDLLKWGANIIAGERKRVNEGGVAIFFPSIANVQVYYDIFKDQYTRQQQFKKNNIRIYNDVEKMRVEIDDIILQIWNEVEAYYQQRQDMDAYTRLQRCQEFGLVYYYRNGEPILTPPNE